MALLDNIEEPDLILESSSQGLNASRSDPLKANVFDCRKALQALIGFHRMAQGSPEAATQWTTRLRGR